MRALEVLVYPLRVLSLGICVGMLGARQAIGAPEVWSPEEWAAARQSFEQGKRKLDASDFAGATANWKLLGESLPESAHLARARLSLSLSTAFELWYAQHPDSQHLLDARDALIIYARETDHAYAGQPQALLGEYRRFSDRLIRLDAAINPETRHTRLPPNLRQDSSQSIMASSRVQLTMPSAYTGKHYWMMVGGGVLTAMGVAALVMGVSASMRHDDAVALGWIGASITLASGGILVGYFGYRRNTISISAARIAIVGSTRSDERGYR